MEIAEVPAGKEVVITDETVMKMLIDYIKVMGKHEIEFRFKCGAEVVFLCCYGIVVHSMIKWVKKDAGTLC